MHITWFGLYCGLMLSISAFSIDIILPAFPGVQESVGATSQQVQMIVPVYLFALGLAHPLFGALSDRYGRKVGIYVGLSVYMLGTVACLFSTSLVTLLAGRFLQGMGAAAGAVVCRAMIRDCFSGPALAQNMAIASMFFAIGPVLAPLIGYLIYDAVGWRGIFVFLIFFAAAMAIATHLQKETLLPERRRRVNVCNMVGDFATIYKHPQSRFFILVGAAASCLIISFLEYAQLLYAQLGADSKRFAYLFALSSLGIIVGQILNHRVITRFGVIKAARVGALIVAFTTFIIMITILGGFLTDVGMTLMMFLFHTSYLIIHANVASLTLDPHGDRAGTAAAVFGFTGYIIGALLAGLVTWIAGEAISVWSVCFFMTALTILLATFLWQPLAEKKPCA